MSFDNKIKELIAIGVSVGVNCQPCLQYHVTTAKELGISEQEIRQAINVGKTVRKGAAYNMDQYIPTLCDGSFSTAHSSNKGCGCGCDDFL